MAEHLPQASYLVAATLFILSLRWLNHPSTARRGVAAGVAGMTAAIVGTLLHPHLSYGPIVGAMIVPTIIAATMGPYPRPGCRSVPMIAAAIPATPAATPRRAVEG